MKFAWRARRKAKGLPTDKPNMVLGHNAQVALEKFALYFDVEARLIDVSADSNYTMKVDEALKMVDENTIGVVTILGSTFTGHFENIKEINDKLTAINEKNGWHVPIHVDGASGAFVAPFVYPDLEWDFRLPLVKSINTSGHKYGLVYPGVGWCLWRSKEDLPEELIFHINYLGGDFPSFTLNFSKSASMVVAQYYNFIRLGREGYSAVIGNCRSNALFLEKCLEETGYFTIISSVEKGLPLIAASLKKDKFSFTETEVSARVRQKGWIIPAYPLPKGASDIKVMRVVVRETHSEDLCETLVKDLVWAVETLHEERQQLLQTHREDSQQPPHSTHKHRGHRKHETFHRIC
jgi:glutamate decarboxylase